MYGVGVHLCTVCPFAQVLVEVLDGANGLAVLHIDMRIVLGTQMAVIRHLRKNEEVLGVCHKVLG